MLSILIISEWIYPFVARILEQDEGILDPSQSDIFPPDSSSINAPAHTSQGWRPYSQNPSNLPIATKQKSRDAAPNLLMPCVLSYNSLKWLKHLSYDSSWIYGKPVVKRLSLKVLVEATFIGKLFKNPPLFFSAQKHLFAAGL